MHLLLIYQEITILCCLLIVKLLVWKVKGLYEIRCMFLSTYADNRVKLYLLMADTIYGLWPAFGAY